MLIKRYKYSTLDIKKKYELLKKYEYFKLINTYD